jgi:hypothetical protein
VIRRIKELLYEEGYTIAGAKKRLQSELDDGKSFAAPEVDGDLFVPEGEGEDDVPVIPVESGPVEPGGASETGASAEAPATAGLATAAESPAEPDRETHQIESGPPPASAAADVEESPAKSSPSRRSRGKAAPKVEATIVEGAAGEVATAPGAVDSALSERVETLQHGLRRVLAEVRHLRELLGDPSSDR